MNFPLDLHNYHSPRTSLNPTYSTPQMSNNFLKLFNTFVGKLDQKKQTLPTLLQGSAPLLVPQFIDDPIQQLSWEMVRALEQDNFFLNYQPQIDLVTGHLLGVETLIRWQHPTLGPVSPATFIPIAEKNGLIVPIGYWVLKQSCLQYQKWRSLGIPPFKLSVNLSLRQLQEADLVSQIQTILQETQMNPQELALEVTESLMYQDPEKVITRLTRLKKMGIQVALDDFGVGYSSLSYLKNLPLHILKIDKSFLDDLITTEKDQVILQSIIELGHRLDLKIIAEGVENQGQVELLKTMNCDYGQGYLFSRPLGRIEMTRYFQDFPKKNINHPPSLVLV